MNNINKNGFPTKDKPFIYEMTEQADIENILESVDPLILMQKISKFRKMNIKNMTDAEIFQAILDVLSNNGIFSCYTNMKMYPAGTKFFRVKKFKGSSFPNSRFIKGSDYWETDPKYLTTYGRLNKPGESLLYVSPDIYCSISEVKIEPSDYFAVIQYTAKEDVKVNMIGGDFDYNALGVFSDKAKLIHEIYNGFLRDEFSRDVGKGTEYLYRVSEKIAKDYFDLPPRIVQDAWAYTSVKDKNKYNVCFRPDIAHELLELDGAMICKLGDHEKLKVYCVAVGVDDKNKILFYNIGSKEQKDVFPEIQ